MSTDSEQFYIWSMEHRAWWAPNRNGYTNRLKDAGLYTRAECDEILHNANWGQLRNGKEPHEAMIPVSTCFTD